jgi:hypothetical protein
MPEHRSWINTVSLGHVEAGVAGSFTQADHGKPDRLRRLARGDRIAFYSPWTKMRSGRPLQQLTALGTVSGDRPHQVETDVGRAVWRLAVDFDDVEPTDIHPLLPRLSFITDQEHWGLPFRQGLFAVPEADMDLIAAALRPT